MALTSDINATGRKIARTLSDASIRGLRDGETRTDGSLPIGFGRLMIQCTKARGVLRKSWLFRARNAGATIKMHLGDYPALPLDEARERARKHIEQVRHGIDPRIAAFEQRQATVDEQREKAALGDFRTLLSSYVAHLRAAGKSSAGEVERLFARDVLKPWPQLAQLPARSVSSEMIRDILARMIKAGIGRQTNIARSYLHAAFVHGAHADLDPRRAAQEAQAFRLETNPVALVPRIEEFEKTRERVLSDDELRSLCTAALQIQPPQMAATLRSHIRLAGQRARQLLRVTTEDYDAEARVVKLIDPKGNRKKPMEHLLPVSDMVAADLDYLVGLATAGPFLFSTTSGLKPIHSTNLSHAISDIAKATCKGERYRPGDFRRSVETRMQALGISRDERAQLLSHGRTSGVQAKHYERYDYLAEKRRALTLWEGHLATVVQGRSEPQGTEPSVSN